MNPVWLLMSAIGVVGANSLVLSPIAGDVAQSFDGTTAPDVMVASAVYGASTAISALILAPKADQIGLLRALKWAMLGLVTALTVSAIAPTIWGLVVAQAVAGLCAGLALPAIYGLSADVAPEGAESATLGKVLTGWTLSLVIGVTLSAFLSDLLHWRVVYAILSCVGAGLLFALRRAQIPTRAATAAATSPLRALWIPGLVPILLSVLAYMIAFYGLYAYLGAHLTIALAYSTGFAGLAALTYGIGFGAVAPLDRLIDRYGANRAAPLVFALLATAYLGLALVAQNGVAVLALCLAWGAANHLGLNILVGQLTALSPDKRGTILGLYSAVTYGSMFVGTAGFKPVFESGGFAATASAAAFCILPALFMSLRRKRSPQNAPS